MAILLNTRTGTSHVLKSLHVVGRDAGHSDTVLTLADASALHATFRWREGQWMLCDHSRNGTFLNGRPLRKDSPVALSLRDEVRFGMLDGTPWRLSDLAAPGDVLVPLTPGASLITLDTYLALPDEQAPQVCLYRSAVGQWVQESPEGAQELRDGEELGVGPLRWRLMCCDDTQATLDLRNLHGESCLRIQTSLDEEHVHVTLFNGSQELDMGERVHHYLLLVLARHRLRDIARGVDPQAQGWVDLDDLVRMLDIDRVHLNIQLFRLRKQFAQAMAEGLVTEHFIERRRGSVRIGEIGLELHQGSRLENVWRPAASSAPLQSTHHTPQP
jgi:hypothetical protein